MYCGEVGRSTTLGPRGGLQGHDPALEEQSAEGAFSTQAGGEARYSGRLERVPTSLQRGKAQREPQREPQTP